VSPFLSQGYHSFSERREAKQLWQPRRMVMKRGGKKRNRNRKKMGRSARASGVLPLLNQFFLFKAVCAPKPEQGAERTAYGAEFQGQKETRRGSQNMHIQITLFL
jgi:hypothetical protein